MSTIIHLTAPSLMTSGSTSLSLDNDDNTLGTLGTTSIALSTTAITTGPQTIEINVRAEELNMTRAYVTSLSQEEKNEMLALLDQQETVISEGQVKKLTLNKERS